MTISMYNASAPAFARGLDSMKNILGKGAGHATARKIDPDVLVTARLFPDMFPLHRQVYIVTDFARGTLARLAGSEPPKWDDVEMTFPDLIARVDRAAEAVKAFTPAQVDGSESRQITRQLRSHTITFTGLDYLLVFSLPNFYFHLATAYDILRHNGVELSKPDFIGALG
jgi:hypothetical protein